MPTPVPTTAPLRLTVNGEPCVTTAASLADLVAQHGLDATSVATAVNGEFVPRTRRTSTRLAAGDNIEIVSPRQGG